MTPNRRAAILLCADFPPSLEVASRRMAAFANVLQQCELDVYVVSAFGGAHIEMYQKIAPNVFAVPVAPPRSFLARISVAAKAFLGRDFGSSVGGRATHEARQDRLLSKLFTRVMTFVTVIDRYKVWSYRAYRSARRLLKARDVAIVVASGPPYSALVAGAYLARRLGARCLIDLRDPLPSSGANEAQSSIFSGLLEQRIERHVVNSADMIFCVSRGLTELLSKKHDLAVHRIFNLPNGFDTAVVSRAPQTGHRLTIVFAGGLYSNRRVDVFFNALGQLLLQRTVDRSKITVKFIGATPSPGWTKIQQDAESAGCADVVQIHGRMGMEALASHMDGATVLLNLAQRQPIQVPAKTYEQLVGGCEVLTICENDSDTGQVLQSIPGAHVVEPDDHAGMLQTLQDLYQRHVRDGLMRQFDPLAIAEHSRKRQDERMRECVSTLLRIKPRVLFVESSMDGTVGGSHISLLHLVRGIRKHGFEPAVVFYSSHELLSSFRSLAISVHLIPGRAAWKSKTSGLSFVVQIANSVAVRVFFVYSFFRFLVLLRKAKIDIVHLNNSVFDPTGAWLLAAKLLGKPCVVHERGWPVTTTWLRRRLALRYDQIICISDAVRRNLLSLNLGPLNLVTIHNGVDVNSAGSPKATELVRAEFHLEPNCRLVGVVGNIQPWKGHDVVIRAIAAIKPEFPDLVCLIVGDVSKGLDPNFEYYLSLRKLIADSGLEKNIVLTGFRKDVANYMTAMEIVIHSSVEPEPFGRVLIEAMVARKPLVATNAGGVPEIVRDGVTGYLVAPGSVSQMASKIAILLRDSDLRLQMGRRGHETVVDKFDIELTSSAIANVYRKLTATI